jgi:hypothetical protein
MFNMLSNKLLTSTERILGSDVVNLLFLIAKAIQYLFQRTCKPFFSRFIRVLKKACGNYLFHSSNEWPERWFDASERRLEISIINFMQVKSATKLEYSTLIVESDDRTTETPGSGSMFLAIRSHAFVSTTADQKHFANW